ncbi:hypothetical protein [Phyllobacterium sp. YR531]|uniref:hypothetical protein n=1 Tax=Phyllobacterium sp. YR531 TaxID=1144343 RepID=UPI00026F75FE|nr:hypothetical protein [Phyllobacterium sp. YR531]EJM98886.1 hypothetical protein PMI41_04648 [Phyllobacterium sp. YR531]
MDAIVITSVPQGDAPLEIRKAWVGLTLPLHEFSRHGPVSMPAISVLAASEDIWLKVKRKFGWTYKAENWWGYVVPSDQAIHILEASSPIAAQWWRKNTPGLLLAGDTLMFDANCCKPLESSGH